MRNLLMLICMGAFIPQAGFADDMADIATLNPKFAAAEKEFVAGEAAKMRSAGLDAKPLYNKIREGLAKGVSSDALRKAVVRERELYTEAARLIAPVSSAGNPTKNELTHSVVIATKRGAKSGDIENAVKQNRQNPAALIGVVDLLGDLARSGISGDKAVRAAMENSGRRSVLPGSAPENRADVNRAILQRESRQDLPVFKPMPEPRTPPTGSQGKHDKIYPPHVK